MREWERNNKEERHACQKEWRHKNSGKVKAYNERFWEKKYKEMCTAREQA